jgi:hypothetical protein
LHVKLDAGGELKSFGGSPHGRLAEIEAGAPIRCGALQFVRVGARRFFSLGGRDISSKKIGELQMYVDAHEK